jgi:hypothetical protein
MVLILLHLIHVKFVICAYGQFSYNAYWQYLGDPDPLIVDLRKRRRMATKS